jgi:rare lipoprotein A (peptidoglycan hydrolase)
MKFFLKNSILNNFFIIILFLFSFLYTNNEKNNNVWMQVKYFAEIKMASVYWQDQLVAWPPDTKFDKFGASFASRTCILGSYYRISNPENGFSIIALCNDRGPYAYEKNKAEIDLSLGSAVLLSHRGLNNVYIELVAISKEFLPKNIQTFVCLK